MRVSNVGKAHAMKAIQRWNQEPDFTGIVADKDGYLQRLYGEIAVPIGLDRAAVALELQKHGLKVTVQRINDFEHGYYTLITSQIKN